MRRAYLFTNHAPLNIISGYESICADDTIIAVDKGLETVIQLGLQPDIIIGDLDSLSVELLSQYPKVPLLRHPSEKNETDTELALLWGVEQGFTELIVCNDLAGRFDHALALVQNLLLLKVTSPAIQTRIESQNQLLFMLDQQTEFLGKQGSLLSLIALQVNAEFADSKGLKYPLQGLQLSPQLSRGISNEIISPQAEIDLTTGLVLAILTT